MIPRSVPRSVANGTTPERVRLALLCTLLTAAEAHAEEGDLLKDFTFDAPTTVDMPLGRVGRFRADGSAISGRGAAGLLLGETAVGEVTLGASLGALPAVLPGYDGAPDGWRAGMDFGDGSAPVRVRLSWFVAEAPGGDSPILPDRPRAARRGVLLELRRTLGTP